MIDIEDDYRAKIKGENLSAFTRYRKVTPLPLLLQMFGQKGKTQHAELLDFYVKHDDSVPSTQENEEYFGRVISSRKTPEHLPVMRMM